MSSRATKATLLALTALFLFPLILAWLMYSGVIDFHPGDTSNDGVLIKPPVPAKMPESFVQAGLGEHWILVYPLPAVCDADCRSELAELEGVRRSLGRNGERVRIVHLVAPENMPPATEKILGIDSGALVLRDASGMLASQLRETDSGNGAYLIDPLGNIMMHYPVGSDPNGMRRDLDRLLKYAKTDPQ